MTSGTRLNNISSNALTNTFHPKSSNQTRLPWFNHKIKKMLRTKQSLYNQAKRTKNWSNYKHYQKECKRQIRKTEWNYINSAILEGTEENNTKPFWKYVKSRKQDNIRVAPLKE
jgi:gas vesicle protein